jgi:flagellum-specific ATP synthase
MWDIIGEDHKKYASKFIETLATHRKFEDMINIGAYKPGSSAKADYAVSMIDRLKGYLRQGIEEKRDFADTLQGLYMLFEEVKT